MKKIEDIINLIVRVRQIQCIKSYGIQNPSIQKEVDLYKRALTHKKKENRKEYLFNCLYVECEKLCDIIEEKEIKNKF